MARGSIDISNLRQLENFERLITGADLTLIDEVLSAGAKSIAESMHKNLQSALSSEPRNIKRRSGELLNSLGISPKKTGRAGDRNIKVGFHNYHPKNAQPNAVIASTINSGRHDRPARPWLSNARRQSSRKMHAAMEKALAEELAKL